MKREEGYYWVLMNNGTNDWRVANYFIIKNKGIWNLHGSKSTWIDMEFLSIDETPITRKTNEPTTKRTDTTIS